VTRELQDNYARKHSKAVQAYVEETIVRRELADNFCFYNKRYDSIEGAAGWAKETLETHKTDER
jgi:deoxyribodipyrimidine photo-lyase